MILRVGIVLLCLASAAASLVQDDPTSQRRSLLASHRYKLHDPVPLYANKVGPFQVKQQPEQAPSVLHQAQMYGLWRPVRSAQCLARAMPLLPHTRCKAACSTPLTACTSPTEPVGDVSVL